LKVALDSVVKEELKEEAKAEVKVEVEVEPIVGVGVTEKEKEKEKKKVVRKTKKARAVDQIALEMEEKEEEKARDYEAMVSDYRKRGLAYLETLKEKDLVLLLKAANDTYHLDKKAIMTDNEYDLIKEYLESINPENAILKAVGAAVEKNKVVLPYEMASMNKIKPDSGALDAWKAKYDGGVYVVSCKLDGVSGMYLCDGSKKGVGKLYTRGNGKVGQDISYLIPHLKLPQSKKMVVRGEFIMKKKVFQEKYSSAFSNIRNLVAGVVNRVSLDEKVGDIDFVAYEVIEPVMKPSEQMAALEAAGFHTVQHEVLRSGSGSDSGGGLTNEKLSSILVDWRASYMYDIDGIIVCDDHVHDRESGNPDYAFAFKMVLTDQVAEAMVVDVLWMASKDGYLKPRVRIAPVMLGGVKIEYATGFNAAFIETNKIGVGALIELVRSGDVIPYIRRVIVPAAAGGKMPHVDYVWNETHVDILLKDVEADAGVRQKRIAGFFTGLGVDGLGEGNVKRIMDAGYGTICDILAMKKEDYLKVDGFKEKMAVKLESGVREAIRSASLVKLMDVSNLFGRGFSSKKLELIMEALPGILTSGDADEKKVADVAAVKGMARKSAELFVGGIAGFLAFLKECGLESKIGDKQGEEGDKQGDKQGDKLVDKLVDEGHPLYGKTVVFSGFRDEELGNALKKVGAKVSTSISSKTGYLVVKSLDGEGGKMKEAKEKGVFVILLDDFKKML
jgi:NAD-dependent DNA ligase